MTITAIMGSCEPYLRCQALVRCRVKQPDGTWGRWSAWKPTTETIGMSAVPDGPRLKVVPALKAWLAYMRTHPAIKWEGKIKMRHFTP